MSTLSACSPPLDIHHWHWHTHLRFTCQRINVLEQQLLAAAAALQAARDTANVALAPNDLCFLPSKAINARQGLIQTVGTASAVLIRR